MLLNPDEMNLHIVISLPQYVAITNLDLFDGRKYLFMENYLLLTVFIFSVIDMKDFVYVITFL